MDAVYLKTLTLKGFKSFAEKTTLDLEPGITVVVGPNGSGKSNVVDAVAWVLGAQGPSTVRSSKMEDVIFAGSGGRPALGRAEVSLTIDNSSGRLPIGLAEVTVTRTLWRSGESEYAINGAACRLLDISELLSDSGVGRHQHVIVSQGQLDAVLSARPEERRLIVEEAAGILKYRRRRERTERRIAATASDLARLEDLVREVRAQLRPLERQAEAAKRHDSLVAESRAIRAYLAGRELAEAQMVEEAAKARCAELKSGGSEMRERLVSLEEELSAAEVVLAEQRVEGHDAAIGSLASLRERARGLAAVVEERRRSVARSLASMVDESVVAALEAEAARLGVELADVVLVESGLAVERAQLESEGASLAGQVAESEASAVTETRMTDREAELELRDRDTVGSGELRGRLGALRSALERERHELASARGSMVSLDRRRAELVEALGAHAEVIEGAEAAGLELGEAASAAEAVRLTAERVAEVAADAVRSAEVEAQTWATRAETLAMALGQLRARGGAAHLEGLDGLLGALADLVEVDHGWEAAFEAALGDASASVVMADVTGAVAALERLAVGGASGLVITSWSPAAGTGGAGDGVVDPSPIPGPTPRAGVGPGSAVALPGPEDRGGSGVGALLGHVRATHPAVSDILVKLLAPVTCVDGDWRAGLDWALAHLGAVVVTRDGDRFGRDGWRVGAPGLGATGAALDEARSRAATSAELLICVGAERVSTELELARAVRSGTELASEWDANAQHLAQATVKMRQAEAELSQSDAEAGSAHTRVQTLVVQVERDSTEVSELEDRLARREAAEADEAERERCCRDARLAIDGLVERLRARQDELGRRSAALDERRSMLETRLVEVEARLARLVEAREEAAGRRQALERASLVTGRLAGVVQGSLDRLVGELARLREERAARAALNEERISASRRLRAEQSVLQADLSRTQEQLHGAELVHAEARFREEAAVESIRRDLEVNPEVAVLAACPQLPAGISAAQRVAQLDRQLRLAGPVNPLAEAELTVLKERAELLDSQLADVQAARSELAKVIRAIDVEMSGVFAAAYQDVAAHFSHLFATLFTGGEGSLYLTEPDDLLETGIEVLARPAGKKVRSISLLSGGERSLVALAFLFAVFRSCPAPFYLLDEVEAALDDVNLQRFLNLIHEFRSDAQLIIVSHQRRTMEVADCLYGVSMPAGGSSRVVSERASPTA